MAASGAGAIVSAMRYRINRTSWRGVRFSLRGKTGEFYRIWLADILLALLTPGIYIRYFQNHVERFPCENTHYGHTCFGYDGEGGKVPVPFILTVVLFLSTLGLSALWHGARCFNHYRTRTAFAGARFKASMTFGGLLRVSLLNLLLISLHLGHR